MNATQKQNRRAKAAGGYITLPPITKNRVAEAYYRKAMTAEMDRMITSMLAEIKRAYTTIPVANAKYAGGKTPETNHPDRDIHRNARWTHTGPEMGTG